MFFYFETEPADTDIDIDIRNDNVALEPVEVIEISLMSTTVERVFGRHVTTIIIRDEEGEKCCNNIFSISVDAFFMQFFYSFNNHC